MGEPSLGSTVSIFAVCSSVAIVDPVLPPPSLPVKRLFFLMVAWGLIARSTMLESISMRPSVRKRSNTSRREMAYRRASASLDFPETRGSVTCQSVKRSRTIIAERSWRAATRAEDFGRGRFPRFPTALSCARPSLWRPSNSWRHAVHRTSGGYPSSFKRSSAPQ